MAGKMTGMGGWNSIWQSVARRGSGLKTSRQWAQDFFLGRARCNSVTRSSSLARPPQGVLALAALEAARRNGELDAWRRDRALPERLPEPVRKAA